MSEKATTWLASRLTDLKIKLEESQNRLLNYKEAEGLVDYGGGVNILSEQEIGIVTSKLLDAEARMAQAKNHVRRISQNERTGNFSTPGCLP